MKQVATTAKIKKKYWKLHQYINTYIQYISAIAAGSGSGHFQNEK